MGTKYQKCLAISMLWVPTRHVQWFTPTHDIIEIDRQGFDSGLRDTPDQAHPTPPSAVPFALSRLSNMTLVNMSSASGIPIVSLRPDSSIQSYLARVVRASSCMCLLRFVTLLSKPVVQTFQHSTIKRYKDDSHCSPIIWYRHSHS